MRSTWVLKQLEDPEKFADLLFLALTPLVERVLSLERDRAELQSRVAVLADRALSYEEIWDGTKTYKRGAMVTHRSTLWFAMHDIPVGERPGITSNWPLMVKHDHR
jgi:hypothetical protein